MFDLCEIKLKFEVDEERFNDYLSDFKHGYIDTFDVDDLFKLGIFKATIEDVAKEKYHV